MTRITTGSAWESAERLSGEGRCRYGFEGLKLVMSETHRGFLLIPAVSPAAGWATALAGERVGGLR